MNTPEEGRQQQAETLLKEWMASAEYLNAGPEVVATVACAFFTHACDYGGVDYLETFKAYLVDNAKALRPHWKPY